MRRQTSPVLDQKLESKHWSAKIQEATVAARMPERSLNLPLAGGADNGQLCSLGAINHTKIVYWSGKLAQGDIILEVQGHKVSGFTLHDLADLIQNLSKNSQPVLIKTCKPALLTKDLRDFLGSMFKSGSPDHELQRIIRDNLYLRVVPCTTRAPRQDEVNGVDYQFLTVDEFFALEKSGSLLESGVYEGNHYGTPKPDSVSSGLSRDALLQSTGAVGGDSSLATADNGSSHQQHNSSSNPGSLKRTARQRNKSTSEALSARSTPSTLRKSAEITPTPASVDVLDSLGILPSNWEVAETEDGQRYFIDHNTGTTQWDDPRLVTNANIKSSNSTSSDGGTSGDDPPLPYGWEKVQDPKYGVFYIDHINKCTQYEAPSSVVDGTRGPAIARSPGTSAHQNPPVFNGSPDQLKGEILRTTLVKSPRGFGFTIIGGSDRSNPEFLQIKNVVSSGPAAVDGILETSDVLVYINSTLVLGYTHSDVVELFQKISVGENVTLTVCKGYSLPFDPNDPNTRVITTVAVSPKDTAQSPQSSHSTEETPVVVSNGDSGITVRPLSRGAVSNIDSSIGGGPSSPGGQEATRRFLPRDGQREFIKVNIVKSSKGFGFTIADNPQGQRVKQILDSSRCSKLAEGDVLVEINNRRVREKTHAEVVQILKQCPIDVEARLLIQRGGLITMNNPPSSSSPQSILSPGQSAAISNGDHSQIGLVMKHSPGGEDMSVAVSAATSADFPTSTGSVSVRSTTPNRLTPASSVGLPSSSSNKTGWRNSAHISALTVSTTAPSASTATSSAMEMGRREMGNYAVANYLEQQKMQRSIDAMNGAFQTANPTTSSSRDNNDYATTGSLQRVRSRTPGPEMGRGATERVQVPVRPKTPTGAQEMHIGSGGGGIWGSNERTPDFVPASRFLEGGSNQGRPSSTVPSVPPATYGSLSRPGRITPLVPLHQDRSRTPQPGVEFQVTLDRLATGFGFRILGGAEEKSQVSIGHIVPNGAADLCRHIRQGDEIVSVNGVSVIGATHHSVVKLMESASVSNRVLLGLRRPMGMLPASNSNYGLSGMQRSITIDPPTSGSTNGIMAPRLTSSLSQPQLNNHHYPYDVTVTRNDSEGFGFVIISSVTRQGGNIGEFIGQLIEGSPAQRCGRLRVGDRILAVNGTDISRMHHENIVNIIKESGYQVTLRIGAPIEDANLPGRVLGGGIPPSNTSNSGYHRFDAASSSGSSARSGGGVGDSSWIDHHEFTVTLHRGNRGFGFSIRGGQEFNQMLFVLRIAEGGAAHVDGKLRVGDQILQINGHNTVGMSHAQAIDIIQSGGSTIRLVIRRQQLPPPPPPPGNVQSYGRPVVPAHHPAPQIRYTQNSGMNGGGSRSGQGPYAGGNVPPIPNRNHALANFNIAQF